MIEVEIERVVPYHCDLQRENCIDCEYYGGMGCYNYAVCKFAEMKPMEEEEKEGYINIIEK